MDRENIPELPIELYNAVGEWLVRVFNGIPPPADPLLGLVMSEKFHHAMPIPDDVLRGWTWHLISRRTMVNRAEELFIRMARASGWSDRQILSAIGMNEEVDLRRHVAELNQLIVNESGPRPHS